MKIFSFSAHTPKRKCFAELKRNDWSQLCDEANSQQSTNAFQNVFDQCKDIRKLLTTGESDVDSVDHNLFAVGPIRQSVRSKHKVTANEPIDSETKVSVRLNL